MILNPEQLEKVDRIYNSISFLPEEPTIESEMLRTLIYNLCNWYFVRMGNEPAETRVLLQQLNVVLNNSGMSLGKEGDK